MGRSIGCFSFYLAGSIMCSSSSARYRDRSVDGVLHPRYRNTPYCPRSSTRYRELWNVVLIPSRRAHRYEKELMHPIQNLFSGELARALLIRV